MRTIFMQQALHKDNGRGEPPHSIHTAQPLMRSARPVLGIGNDQKPHTVRKGRVEIGYFSHCLGYAATRPYNRDNSCQIVEGILQCPVTMSPLLQGTKREYQKMGKVWDNGLGAS
ncbi:hypothetical protein [Coleofasciculus chthonoplastes]|uniref:hypothetical protein n=1 Tax=Coleofasciculus chthonoplastes TaxID=64178 RepID=UPI0032FA1994